MGVRAGYHRAWGAVLALWLAGCARDRLEPVEAVLAAQGPVDFGNVRVGSQGYANAALVNRTEATVKVFGVQASPPFQGAAFDPPLVLPPGARRLVRVGFAPVLEGEAVQDAPVLSDADQVGALHLHGLGAVVRLSTQPPQLDFGMVDLDDSRTLPLTLQNTGNVAAQVSLAGVDGPDGDLFSADSASVTVPAGGQASLGLTFRGAHLGTSLATAHLLPCPECEPLSVPLQGGAVAAAVSVQPDRVDFGRVAVGGTAQQAVTISNVGLRPFQVKSLYVTAGSDPSFTTSPVSAFTLNPGEQRTVTVSFSPSGGGARQGDLRLETTDPRAPMIDVPLAGGGDAAASVVDPLSIDFGPVPLNMTSSRSVVLYNTSAASTVTLTGAQVTGSLAFAGGALMANLAPGDHVVIPVAFNPRAVGSYQGTLQVKTSDATLQVALTGSGINPAPCKWAALPPVLDYGTAAPGEVRHLSVALEDVGSDDCYLGDVDLASASDPAFSLTDGAVPGALLHPGDVLTIRISFVPPASGSFQGALTFLVSDPASPTGSVPITGKAAVGCLTLSPVDLDYGTVRGACGGHQLGFTATNTCSGTLQVAKVALGPGDDSSEFTLVAGPTGPHDLTQGASETFSVRYDPVNDGPDSSQVQVTLADGTVATVALEGNGSISPTQTDHFAQHDRTQVDQLFVLDNSGSLADKQAALTANFQTFIQEAVSQAVDYHIAATTTGVIPAATGWSTCPGGAEGGEAGRLFPADNSSPRIITPTTADPQSAFASMVNVGTCHWLEQGLEGAYLALSPPLVDSADDPATALANDGNLGFLRPDARLSIIVISDADDQSDRPVSFYENYFRALKGNKPDQLVFNAVITPADKTTSCPSGESVGARYIQLAQDLGGQTFNICSTDWGGILGTLAKAAFGPSTRFPLTATPSDPSQLQVSVNGQPVSSGWSYDPASNAVVFDSASAPPPGSSVDVTYPLGC